MRCSKKDYIFFEKRYLKLAEYSLKLSENKSRNEFRKALREILNKAVKEKAEKRGEKGLFAGLGHATSLLQILISKSIFSEEFDFEEIIPKTAERCLVRHILCEFSNYKCSDWCLDLSQLEDAVIIVFRNLDHSKSNPAYRSLACNFHEIVVIMQEIIDEL